MWQFRVSRRQWITRTATLFLSSALPQLISKAYAQSKLTPSNLPRIGLVIGNSQYPETPLRNAANDARTIASELHKVGFQVDLKIDATRGQMREGINALSAELSRKQAVGLFY